MAEKFGVENLEKFVLLGGEGGRVGSQIKTQWKSGMGATSLLQLLQLTDELAALAAVDYSLLDDEWKDLSADERKRLADAFASKFDIANDKAEEMVEKIFRVTLTLVSGVQELVVLGKELAK
jgi:hypothetical protein